MKRIATEKSGSSFFSPNSSTFYSSVGLFSSVIGNDTLYISLSWFAPLDRLKEWGARHMSPVWCLPSSRSSFSGQWTMVGACAWVSLVGRGAPNRTTELMARLLPRFSNSRYQFQSVLSLPINKPGGENDHRPWVAHGLPRAHQIHRLPFLCLTVYSRHTSISIYIYL